MYALTDDTSDNDTSVPSKWGIQLWLIWITYLLRVFQPFGIDRVSPLTLYAITRHFVREDSLYLIPYNVWLSLCLYCSIFWYIMKLNKNVFYRMSYVISTSSIVPDLGLLETVSTKTYLHLLNVLSSKFQFCFSPATTTKLSFQKTCCFPQIQNPKLFSKLVGTCSYLIRIYQWNEERRISCVSECVLSRQHFIYGWVCVVWNKICLGIGIPMRFQQLHI